MEETLAAAEERVVAKVVRRRSTGHWESADDVAQVSRLAVWKVAKKYAEPCDAFWRDAYGRANAAVIDYLRTCGLLTRSDIAAGVSLRRWSADTPHPVYSHEWPDADLELHPSIAHLPADRRRWLVLRYGYDEPTGAIAAAFGVPAHTVGCRLSRSLAEAKAGPRKEVPPVARKQTLGSRHPRSKLAERDVDMILSALASGVPAKRLAASFGVSKVNVLHIKSGKTWSHWRPDVPRPVVATKRSAVVKANVGDAVRVNWPDNERVHDLPATVREVADWGYHLDVSLLASGTLRVTFDEVSVETPVPRTGVVKQQTQAAKEQGYTGDCCRDCGSFKMKRNGACLLCVECGTTTGCS